MKCGGEKMLLANQDGEAVALGQYFDIGTCFYNAGGANEDHFQRTAFKLCFGVENGAVNLASVRIALYRHVEHGKAFLRRIQHLFCQQNAAGAGTEGRLLLHKRLQGVEKSVAGEELQECGRFSAGNNQAIDCRQLFRFANEDCLGTGITKGNGMRVIVALNCEYADARWVLCCGSQVLPLLTYIEIASFQ